MVLFVLFWCLSCSGWAEWLHCRPVHIDAFYQDFVHDQLWKHFYFFIKISKTIWCFTRGVITGLQCFKVRHSAQSLGNSIFWNWMADIHLHKVQLFWEGHRNLRNRPHGLRLLSKFQNRKDDCADTNFEKYFGQVSLVLL